MAAKYQLLLLLLCLLFCACRKSFKPPPHNNNIPGLPPVTQSGANTLGFLLNGVPWTPEGNNNLSVDFDPGFNEGIVGVVAYRLISASNHSVFSFGIQDSLNYIHFPKKILVGKKTLAQFSFTDSNFCERIHYDTVVYRNGYLTISVLDKTKRVFAGTFEATLFNPQCGDTIKITNGRFDLKF